MTHDLWTTLNFKMYEYLESVALADLVAKQLTKVGGDVALLKDARHCGSGARNRSVSALA